MAPRRNSVHADAFDRSNDFNAQLYAALRGSPWWMISISAHVLLFVISSFFSTPAQASAPRETAEIRTSQADVPPEDQPDPGIEDIETPAVDEVNATEPQVVDAPEIDKPRTDNDVPYDEIYGTVKDGTGAGDFEGPSSNVLVGIGGGLAKGGWGMGSNRSTKGSGANGTTRATQAAVEDALKWLAAHQSPDGSWEAEGFTKWCDGKRVDGGPDGAGKAQNDVGVSGLALLAFLGAGYTHRSEGPFGDVMRRGLKWMVNTQDAEGCFGSRASGHFVYSHAIAALAVVEAYGMTGGTLLKNPSQKALDFIAITRNPYFAWRYGIKPGDNDTSVTGWMMMALKSARLVNEADAVAGRSPSLVIDADAFDGIRAWIDKMTDPDNGRVGYQARGSGAARPTELVDRFPAEKSESMTAVGVLARIFLGEDPRKSDAVRKGADLMAKKPPKWDTADGSIDMYYWYYATLAMFQVGGDAWKTWDGAMKHAIVDSQRKDGDYCGYRGSWDPVDPWGADGGRVYSTAVMATCLQVYYRYGRVVGIGK